MLIEFKPWHLDMMRLTAEVRAEIGAFDSPAILARLAAAGFAFTIVAEEGEQVRILGIAGAAPIEDGRAAEVFVVASEDRRRHRVEFVKSVRRILDRAKARFARIDALGKDTPARWFKALGFTRVSPERWSMGGAI